MKWTKMNSHPSFKCNLCNKEFNEGGFVYEEPIAGIPVTVNIIACTTFCCRKIEKHPAIKTYIKDLKERAVKAYESRDIREEEKAKAEFEGIMKEALTEIGLKVASPKDN